MTSKQVLAREDELFDALCELFQFTSYAATDPRLWWFMQEDRWQQIADRCIALIEGPEPTYFTACEACGEMNIEIIEDMAATLCESCDEEEA